MDMRGDVWLAVSGGMALKIQDQTRYHTLLQAILGLCEYYTFVYVSLLLCHCYVWIFILCLMGGAHLLPLPLSSSLAFASLSLL